MTWFNILKMPNPHGGQWKDLTRDEYYEMDDKNQYLYHATLRALADKKIRRAVEPRKAGQAPPKTDDQIRELREEQRFHSRQEKRIRNNSKRDTFYSEEDENNRRGHVGIFDAVDLREHTTQEMYDNYSREEKILYWYRSRGFSEKEGARMRKNPNYTPRFEGDESTQQEYKRRQNNDLV